MASYSIAVIPGDGIGKEVVPAAMKVVDAAGRRFGFDCQWTSFDWGCERHARTGKMMPDDGLEQLRRPFGVARADVGQHEPPHARLARDSGSGGGGGVAGLPRSIPFLLRERRLVHEDVGVPRNPDRFGRGTRVPRVHDLAAGPRRTHELRGMDATAVFKLHALPAMEAAEERTLGDTHLAGGRHIEPPGTGILDERVSE